MAGRNLVVDAKFETLRLSHCLDDLPHCHKDGELSDGMDNFEYHVDQVRKAWIAVMDDENDGPDEPPEPYDRESDPVYRQNMTDAGRGHLLK